MARDIPPERVIQLIALCRDHDARAEKMVCDFDPWQKDELIWKLLTVINLVLDGIEAAGEMSAEEVLAGIIDEVKGINDDHSGL